MLVLHRAKLLASNQSVPTLGVAPSGVRAAAPHFSPFPRGRGLGLGIENLLIFLKINFFQQSAPVGLAYGLF